MTKDKSRTIATCAVCGEEKELCDSARIDGIKQPRLCTDCLMEYLSDNAEMNDLFWVKQIYELGDTESINALSKTNSEE